MRSFLLLLLAVATILLLVVTPSESFQTVHQPTTKQSPLNAHNGSNRRAFVSAAVLSTLATTAASTRMPAFAVEEDLAMPTAEEQKKLDDVRNVCIPALFLIQQPPPPFTRLIANDLQRIHLQIKFAQKGEYYSAVMLRPFPFHESYFYPNTGDTLYFAHFFLFLFHDTNRTPWRNACAARLSFRKKRRRRPISRTAWPKKWNARRNSSRSRRPSVATPCAKNWGVAVSDDKCQC